MSTNIFLLTISLATILCPGCASHEDNKNGSPDRLHGENNQRTIRATFGDYVFSIHHNRRSSEGEFHIFRNGTEVYSESGEEFEIIDVSGSDGQATRSERVIIPKDITGDGTPDLIVSSFSNGAHCCFRTIIFSIGDTFKKIGEINGENSMVEFRDIDHDGVPEVIALDWVFQYWNAPFSDSPAAEVILKYDNGYRLAIELMKKPLPSKTEYEAKAAVVKKLLQTHGLHPSLWAFMLKLIYTGNGDAALQFAVDAWPDGMAGREAFLADFMKRLHQSQYWSGIRDLNEWKEH